MTGFLAKTHLTLALAEPAIRGSLSGGALSLDRLKFAEPAGFALLLLTPVLAALWLISANRSKARVGQMVALRLRNLLVGQAPWRGLQTALLIAGLALGSVAIARPQLGEILQERKGRGRDVIIAVDVSRSMLAGDLPPSRLKRAQMAAEDLVRQLKGDRVGLVAFAGSSFLQAPVTADHAAVLTAMQELGPELIPLPGTNIASALRCAEEAFDHSEGGQRALVLITDGEELEEDAVAISQELSAKMRIFTVGVGSPEGAVLAVPAPQGGGIEYIKDSSGNVVQSKLDEGRLRQIAQAGGGFYTRLLSGPAEMRRIALEGIAVMDEHEVQLEGRSVAIERYQWPLGAALLLIATGFLMSEGVRRRAIALITIGLFAGGMAPVLQSTTASAATNIAAATNGATATNSAPEGSQATTRPTALADEKKSGRALYDAGEYAAAQEAFNAELVADRDYAHRAFNLGAAAYKNKQWAEAIDAFGKALNSKDPTIRSRAEYNFANTLVQQARQGRRGQDTNALQQAIDHYEESIRQDASFEDAAVNRDLVKKILAQPPPPPQQKNEKNDKKDKKDDKDKQENEQDSEGEKSESKDGEQNEQKDSSKQRGSKDQKDSQGKDQTGKPENDPGDGEKKEPKDGEAPPTKEEENPEQKERGELKNVPAEGKDGKQEEKKPEQQQGGDGKITREQAAALLEALRSEDRRVNLWGTEQQKNPARSKEGKTW